MSDSNNPIYDLAVIGAGATGLIAARFARRIGASVVLIDKGPIGGDCTWTGCIPSKALIHIAKLCHSARSAGRFGFITQNATVDWGKAMSFLSETVQEVYSHTTPEQLESEGIRVVIGEASFSSPERLKVGGREVQARKFLICTGAEPSLPPISGLAESNPLTYLSLFGLESQPKRLGVLGAGPIGSEMAQTFARLGTEVTLFDQAILPREEPEAGTLLQQIFEAEGVRFVSGLVERVERRGLEVVATLEGTEFKFDQLLVSTGRRAKLDGLNLEAAGVRYGPKGIDVESSLKTSSPNIYAAGDCIGSYQFSHFAGWQGFQAVRSALLPGSGTGQSEVVPWCTFTDPEVARVGLLESEAKSKFGSSVKVSHVDLARVDRALCDGDEGFIKLLSVGNKIVGATVVASRAGELINEVALAMKADLGADRIAGTIHAYPTYNSALQLLASDIAVETFFTSFAGKAALTLSGLKTPH